MMSTAETEETPPEASPIWKDAAEQVAADLDADVLIFNGDIARWHDRALIDACRGRRRRPSVILILVTNGGNADAGYRMARCLQRYYPKVIVYVSGYCKSAGTLIATGAHELVIADHGELGPLDVQMVKQDELWETSSGLTVMEAINTLEETAYRMLEDGFIRIKAGSGGQITFKMASEIAVSLVTGLLDPIYKQIDPMHVGEAGRAMKIARDYGERLNAKSLNLRPNALVELLGAYSSHGFVIDREEAGKYFERVREPSPAEEELANKIGDGARVQLIGENPTWGFLSEEPRLEGGSDERAAAGTAEEDGRTNGRTAPEVAAVAGDHAREQASDDPASG
jgi:hypothetical protein